MSMLGMQADELRSKAKLLRSHADGLTAPLVIPSTKELMALTMLDSASRMEDAADTIEKLEPHSNQLEPSRWHELFGTPERAARTWIEFNGIYRCADCPICHDEMGVTCEIPGECAWEDEEGGYDALLEWLEGADE